MLKVAIDGSAHTGNYRVECACQDYWGGQGETTGETSWSPALAIAEAIVHMRMRHGGARADIEFSDRFRAWLTVYWEQATRRVHRQQVVAEARFRSHVRGAPPR
jgi:hypothetical protein